MSRLTLSRRFSMREEKDRNAPESMAKPTIKPVCCFCHGRRKAERKGGELRQLVSPPNAKPDIRRYDGYWVCGACWEWSAITYQHLLKQAIAEFNFKQQQQPLPVKPKPVRKLPEDLPKDWWTAP